MRMITIFSRASGPTAKQTHKKAPAAGVCMLEIWVQCRDGYPQLTWLALGEDQAARSRRVEQLMALWRPVTP